MQESSGGAWWAILGAIGSGPSHPGGYFFDIKRQISRSYRMHSGLLNLT
ncbi:hypothetical protein [Arthrobacter sp. LFS091]